MKPGPTPIPVHALALAKLPGVGRRRLRTLLARVGPGRVATSRELERLVREHGADRAWHLRSQADVDQAWRDAIVLADTCQRRGWRAWVLGAPDYPSSLMRLADPPALLFVHGADQPAETPRVAIIGTREPTPWGERTAADCAREVASAGGIVVSGLAWGIDTAAHRAAVAASGCTWAVLPSALDAVFPASNAALAERIVETGGALISEYLPGTRPHPRFFVERDRLQAALSRVVVVIETGLKGGTMHTVGFARQLGVPLHVTFPSDLDPAGVGSAAALPASQQGTWLLLREGAARTTPEDVGRLTRAGADGAAPSMGRRKAGTPGDEKAAPTVPSPVGHRQGRLFDRGDER